jgi:hypothetical protein
MSKEVAEEIEKEVKKTFVFLHDELKKQACTKDSTMRLLNVFPNIQRPINVTEELLIELASRVAGALVSKPGKFNEWLNKRIHDGIVPESLRFDATRLSVMIELENHELSSRMTSSS